ncbi:APC amino acid permease [Cantharellus anzutake]|uniref:APC amino acid permease n=1 Tax=Cantharellus anzutake TaxID=1750568 RepID=UPI001906EF29|nr:APC amino acid permease [Cantharellus anzutake]KAF8331863.1 APC amino acid permease [Cantharellus anzutake]
MAPSTPHPRILTNRANLDDDDALRAVGYVPSFKREFTNLDTISFAFSIMGVCSSIAMTFNTPLTLGGPAAAQWCWLIGGFMCFTLGTSIAELVSAFPTAGGLYTASARLVPPKHRALVGWIVGWLNMLGQVAGVSSTEFGLSQMIWAAVVVAKDGNYTVTPGKIVSLFVALLILHGILNSVATKYLARFTKGFVFINLGATILITIVLLACTGANNMHSAAYVFGSEGIINGTSSNGGVSKWNDGIAFLFGLLSVQWTVRASTYATAHISEEVRRAAVAAPTAIFVAVIGTGIFGWLLNIALVLCSGPLEDLPGPTGLAFIQIMWIRIGKSGTLFLWAFVCLTAFFVVQTALQACSRTFYAFSRDNGFPDKGFFGRMNQTTKTPIFAVWLTVFLSALPGLLDLVSSTAAAAIFALTAVALDTSYIIPIACRRIFRNHPEVNFTPGPFYLGEGWLGWLVNVNCILWVSFVTVILSLPTVLPITKDNFNYASVITGAVIISSFVWYIFGGRLHYKGPTGNLSGIEVHHPPRSYSAADLGDNKKPSVEV